MIRELFPQFPDYQLLHLFVGLCDQVREIRFRLYILAFANRFPYDLFGGK